MDSLEGRACKFGPDLGTRMAPRARPAVKLSIAKITTVREPYDEIVFELVTEAAASALPGEILCLRPSTFFFRGSKFPFADSRLRETSGGASASTSSEF